MSKFPEFHFQYSSISACYLHTPGLESSLVTIEDIQKLTREYGQAWGYPHACRVLALVERISEGISYDILAMRYAAYLHDWGAFPKFHTPGSDHAALSAEIARTQILPQTSMPAHTIDIIVEAIARHDYRDPRPPSGPESLLLREADFLDFLGAIGIARELAWGPNDIPRCLERLIARRDALRNRFTLPAAQAIASRRLTEMDHFLNLLSEESFGAV
ncbi:MAG: HD domain-containing protein [Chloroflexota bacterium]|nr:MAG: HD domain-containing protein [Chloroflexota bacterium]